MTATLIAAPAASRPQRRRYVSSVYRTLLRYTDRRRFSAGLTPALGGGLRFYDDNAWVGMDLLQADAASRERRLLRAAEGILKFQRTGKWRVSDSPDQRRYPGGIYWNANRRVRSLQATAGTSQFALQLYRTTHNRHALAVGIQEYKWIRQTLGTPTGLYRQRVDPGGAVVGAGENNGDGYMIHAGLLLYQITGQKQYLNQATQTAKASLRRFTPSVLEHTCPAYDTSFLANLMTFNTVARLPSVPHLVSTYAAWIAKHSNRKTGAFERRYSCQPAAPQAGATGALILQAVG